MNKFRILFFTISLVALTAVAGRAADWPMFLGDAAHSGCIASSINMPLNQKWTWNAGAPIAASPVKSGDKVYIAALNGILYALNAYSGAILWQYDAGAPLNGSPAATDNKVIINTQDGRVIGLNAAGGGMAWIYSTGGQNFGSLTVAGGKVFFGAGNPVNSVFALDAGTGALVWQFSANQPVHSAPAVLDGVVWVGAGNGKLYRLDAASGGVLSQKQTGGTIYVSSPALSNGNVFAAAGEYDLNVYALSAASGAPVWSAEPVGTEVPLKISSVSACNGRALLSLGYPNQKITALNTANGGVLWQYDAGGFDNYNYLSTPISAANAVFVGSVGGALNVLDATSGAVLQQLSPGGAITGTPALADGMVIVGTMDGNVSAWFGADNTPPTAAITSPQQDALAGHSIAISGTADDTNLQNYLLEYGADAAPSSWTQIATVSGKNVVDGALETWKPEPSLPSGVYTIRLTATDVAGNTSATTVTVQIDNTPPTFAGLATAAAGPGDNTATLHWNPASDSNGPITYSIYIADNSGAQDFDTPFASVTGLEAVVSPLSGGAPIYFVVRAGDGFGNEDANTVEFSAVPTGSALATRSETATGQVALFIPGENELTLVAGGADKKDSKGRPVLMLIDAQKRPLIVFTDTFKSPVPADDESEVEVTINVYDMEDNPASNIPVKLVNDPTKTIFTGSRGNFTTKPIDAIEPRQTGRNGDTAFTFTSRAPGEYWFRAHVNNKNYGPAFRVAYAGVPLTLTDVHVYPNPWRPREASLQCFAGVLSNAAGVEVVISIFDIRGTKVRDIFTQALGSPAGATQKNLTCWDGVNNGGRLVASGVYLYSLAASDSATRVTANGKLSIVK